MKKVIIKNPTEITPGVSLASHKAKAHRVFEGVVKPRIANAKKNQSKDLKLSAVQKIYSECQSPY